MANRMLRDDVTQARNATEAKEEVFIYNLTENLKTKKKIPGNPSNNVSIRNCSPTNQRSERTKCGAQDEMRDGSGAKSSAA